MKCGFSKSIIHKIKMNCQSLYAYDFDRTYDLLWADHIGAEILAAMKGISNWLFSPDLSYMPVALIDRYTPDNLPWADNWIDLNFEVLKILSKTHLLDNYQLLGIPAGLPPSISWNREILLNGGIVLPAVPETIIVSNNRSSKPISLTWLELAFTAPNEHGKRSERYNRNCKIFNKRKLILKPNERRVLKPALWLRNSLVISEANALSIEASQGNIDALLYSELESQLELILSQLQITEFQIVGEIDLTIDYTLKFQDGAQYGSSGRAIAASQIEIPSYSNPVYKEIPEWYYFTSLIRADNNPWGVEGESTDKGKPISVVYLNNSLDLKIWNVDYIPFSGSNWPNSGIDDQAVYFKLGAENYQSATNWLWDFSLNRYRRKIDNHYWTGFLGLVENPDISKGFITTYGGFNNRIPTKEWFTETFYVYEKNQLNGWKSAFYPFFSSTDYLWNFSVSSLTGVGFTAGYLFLPSPDFQFPLNNINLLLHCSQACINTCYSDWNQRRWLIESYRGFVFFPRAQILAFDSLYYENWYAIEESISVSVSHENLEGEILATRTIEPEETADLIYSWTQGETVARPLGYSRTGSRTLTIDLEFWEEPPEGKDIFTDEQVRAIVDGIQANEPDPEAIVMPDSIRIKEIHAALQADKYSSDPDNPDELRIANLGYYIERLARTWGISVNPDGSIRSIRQSKHIAAGRDLPAGWPIGQWGRNQGGNRDGQRGGEETEDRDGLAYEVRSNRFTVNRFTGQPDKIEPGGYILVENWPQLLHVLLDDLDKAIGWQEAGASVIPDANKQGRWATYEGLNSLMAEIAYMLSDLSQNIKGGHISGLISQAVLYEVLGAIGLPYNFKRLKVEAEGAKEIHYPALEANAPTVVDLLMLILQNIAPLVGSKINIYPELEEDKK